VYYCLDLASNCLIISHHVSFDESSFPFAEKSNQIPSSDFDFLSEFNLMPLPIGSCFPSRVSVGTSASGDGSPLVATTPGHSTHLPKAIGLVAGCSAHLPEVVGPVPVVPVVVQQAALPPSGPAGRHSAHHGLAG
jgi:hypothetical protein